MIKAFDVNGDLIAEYRQLDKAGEQRFKKRLSKYKSMLFVHTYKVKLGLTEKITFPFVEEWKNGEKIK